MLSRLIFGLGLTDQWFPNFCRPRTDKDYFGNSRTWNDKSMQNRATCMLYKNYY